MKSTYLKYLRFTKNFKWAKFLLSKSIPITDFKYNKKSNTVYIRSVDHSFSYGEFPLFFEGYNSYCWKFIDNGFQFIFRDNDLFLKLKDIIIKIETLEELYIINEVFIENIYKIESKSN